MVTLIANSRSLPVPDYDIGISVLLAGELPANANFNLLGMDQIKQYELKLQVDPNLFVDVVGEVLIPAVEEAARAEAGAIYNGHYTFANIRQLNSSMTIKTDDEPGLSVSQWISNGTDFAWTSVVLQNGTISGRLGALSPLESL
jgi:hypothetical protein